MIARVPEQPAEAMSAGGAGRDGELQEGRQDGERLGLLDEVIGVEVEREGGALVGLAEQEDGAGVGQHAGRRAQLQQEALESSARAGAQSELVILEPQGLVRPGGQGDERGLRLVKQGANPGAPGRHGDRARAIESAELRGERSQESGEVRAEVRGVTAEPREGCAGGRNPGPGQASAELGPALLDEIGVKQLRGLGAVLDDLSGGDHDGS